MAKSKLFFWKNKGESEIPKAEEMLELYLKYVPRLRAALDGQESEFIKQMYDFYADWAETMGYRNHIIPRNAIEMGLSDEIIKDARQEIKPILVKEELETIPVPFTLEDLDEKINLFKAKSTLIAQKFSKAQVDGFIQRLLNRQHYIKYKDFWFNYLHHF